jgi:ORF6N domain
MVKTSAPSLIPVERIAATMYSIRGQTVMFDADLAALYGVETRVLVQAVKRNADRFPEDFMFRLTDKETENLRSQIVTSSWGGRRYNPYAFTEHGVAMLSSVLRSKRAVEININIVRTFVRLRRILASNEELARKVAQHDRQIATLFEYVKTLLEPPPAPKKRPIGFIHPKD